MSGSFIAGTGTALPARSVPNADIEQRLALAPGWIAARTGIEARRIADPAETVCTMGTAAARDAVASAGLSPGDLDYVIVATSTADLALPAAASLLQTALGCDGGAFDLNAGCAGFLLGLAQADALVRSGGARHVLVAGVDVMSRVTDPDDPKTAILFGDGAGAVVVSGCSRPAMGPFVLHSDGAAAGLLYAPRDGGKIVMAGREVYRRAVQEMTGAVQEVVGAAGVGLGDVRLVVAHQANARILAAVAERLGVDAAKVFTNIARYGNTSAASIPLALAEAGTTGALADGDLVVVTAFGAGFQWGAACVRWVAPRLNSRDRRAAGAVSA